ncbi:MAG: hypothetical protein M1816_000958 [Peltula sp. TS41687]|nr:MAG: hypothetical protein M1816_000958 [Peltula sp. TS41687]
MAFSLFRKVREAQSAAAEAKQAAAKYEVGDPVVLSLTTKRKISWKAPALKHKTARINGTITSRMLKNKKWLYVVQNFNGYYIAGWKRERDLSPYDVERVDFWPDLSPSNKSSPRLKSSAAIPESAKPLTLFPAELPGSAEIPVLKDRKYERHKSSRFARDSLDSAGQPPTLDSAALTLPDVSELIDLPELPGSAEIPVLKDRKYERHKSSRFARDSLDSAGQPPTLDSAALTLPDVSELLDLPELPGSAEIPVLKDRKYERHKPRGLASPSQEWPADTRDRAPVGSKKSPLATASLAGPFTPVYPLVDATQNAELKLSPSADNKHVYPDMLEAIRKEMIPALDSSERQTAIFHVRWSLPEYCEKELESHEQLASVLTVTGTAGLAYATTCKEYLNRFWPQSELPLFLEMPLLLEAIVSNRNLHGRKRKKRFNLWRTSSRFLHWSTEDGREYEPEDEVTMHVLGSREYLIEVAQQLAWFSAVCRVPNHGKLTYSDVVFETVKSREFRLYTIGLQPIREEEYSCWHPMFVGSVIARGFPIPERRKEIGIELPFEVMISLGQILYPVEYEDGVILKGYSTILVPTNQGPDSVQWHFIRTNDRRKRIPMDSIIQYCPTHFETVDFTFLAGARTFVGYCRKAEIHLGTQGSGYEKIERSTARPEGTRMELSREISASLGSSGMGYFGGSITPKIIIAKGLLGTTRSDAAYLEDRLLNSKEQSIILYDVEKKRGWLVPELSVVLHIAHAWATRQHDSQELLNKIPHAEISGDGGEAAYAAIMRNNTLQLRSISANGEPLAFMDLMKNILNADGRFVLQRSWRANSTRTNRTGLCLMDPNSRRQLLLNGERTMYYASLKELQRRTEFSGNGTQSFLAQTAWKLTIRKLQI